MEDREYLPLSWLSQICYCPRRAGLLLNERIWVENADTAKGRAEHEHVHAQHVERRGDLIKLYEYTVFSDQLALNGKCDCVEAMRDDNGCAVPAADFPVRLYPIEYKHGSVRDEEAYKIQLCAQAMCLEEMFQTSICEGAIFFISSRRRVAVSIDEPLRNRTLRFVTQLHEIRSTLRVPAGSYGAQCRRCSLAESCMPKTKQSAKRYLQNLREEAEGRLEEEL